MRRNPDNPAEYIVSEEDLEKTRTQGFDEGYQKGIILMRDHAPQERPREQAAHPRA